jgi:hypothetical protein
MLLGRFPGSSHWAVPACTMRRSMVWYSVAEPSHQATFSGWHMAATS